MKRWSSAALAALALIAVTACQDTITSPQANPELRYASNPPPPPARTVVDGSFSPDTPPPEALLTTGGLRFDVTPSFSLVCFFQIPATYMFNKPGNNGWLHFEDADDVESSSNGMVTQKKLRISGKGTLVIDCGGGVTLTIDLSSITGYPDSYLGCPNVPELLAAPSGPPLVCFHFHFTEATLTDGITTVEGDVYADEGFICTEDC